MPPTATYRLQLHREFGFAAAAEVVPYLADLGASHVYCSPVLQAAPGSQHGYDVVDHSHLSADLGGDADWAVLVGACHRHGLGLVVDIVPNHMGIPTPERLNHAFWDVLRLGRDSPYAEWFDADWDVHGGRLLLPVLGAPPAEVSAEIEVDAAAGEVRYHDHRFPLAPQTSSLEEQHYVLASWREADTDLNYRRFFDVTTLIGVRVESPAVFAATHERLLELVRAGQVDGLRVDHPDGLRDPRGYLDRLAAASVGAWTVAEKILEPGEVLPPDWKCAGTTGYDALAAVTHALVDQAGERPLTDLYAELTGMPGDYQQVVDDAKRLVVTTMFRAEVSRLTRELGEPGDDTRAAIEELLVAFDIYRVYPSDPASLHRLDEAVDRAQRSRPDLADQLHKLRTELTGTGPFAVRFAQTTGPVMAKGVEDTAFYRYHRLVALNEVGGDPGTFGSGVEAWHEHCARLATDWPTAMTTLSTHDTKRSEDVRARLLVLAEIPDEWRAAVTRWRAAAQRHAPPDANADYLFWQTLVGAFPIEAGRLQDYMTKATHEAKQRTSWTDPDVEYDAAVRDYVAAVLADTALVSDVADFVRTHLDAPGRSNALAQKLLQLTMPGIPDTYQGQELTDRSLVDPDNRRPVDYAQRARALADPGTAEPKLRLTAAALRLRRDRPEAFAAGYTPLTAAGPASAHVVAARRGDDVVTVATRLPVGLRRRGGWADESLALPPGEWTDVCTGRPATAAVGDLLAELPVALLVRDGGNDSA
jgi:(1->4)-alpha-D-glucan 1-alpha-D-glucosylmutase